jgi:hypothetical protein
MGSIFFPLILSAIFLTELPIGFATDCNRPSLAELVRFEENWRLELVQLPEPVQAPLREFLETTFTHSWQTPERYIWRRLVINQFREHPLPWSELPFRTAELAPILTPLIAGKMSRWNRDLFRRINNHLSQPTLSYQTFIEDCADAIAEAELHSNRFFQRQSQGQNRNESRRRILEILEDHSNPYGFRIPTFRTLGPTDFPPGHGPRFIQLALTHTDADGVNASPLALALHDSAHASLMDSASRSLTEENVLRDRSQTPDGIAVEIAHQREVNRILRTIDRYAIQNPKGARFIQWFIFSWGHEFGRLLSIRNLIDSVRNRKCGTIIYRAISLFRMEHYRISYNLARNIPPMNYSEYLRWIDQYLNVLNETPIR